MPSKDKILAKLKKVEKRIENTPFDSRVLTSRWELTGEERIPRIKELLELQKTEVYVLKEAELIPAILRVLNEKNIGSLLYAPETELGIKIMNCQDTGGILLKKFDKCIEEWKEELFNHTPAAVTETVCGVSSVGGLILSPTAEEPRSMSLVPHVHIAVLNGSRIYDTLYEAVKKERWSEGLPTNLLMISGPSKTADIEQVLAYGAHGPKELIVFILEDV